MDTTLKVKHTLTHKGAPLCVVQNFPGLDAELTPAQMRALAIALMNAAEDCEANRACESQYRMMKEYVL